jgi:hypothetical protein
VSERETAPEHHIWGREPWKVLLPAGLGSRKLVNDSWHPHPFLTALGSKMKVSLGHGAGPHFNATTSRERSGPYAAWDQKRGPDKLDPFPVRHDLIPSRHYRRTALSQRLG